MRKGKRKKIGLGPVQRVLFALSCWYVDRLTTRLEAQFAEAIVDMYPEGFEIPITQEAGPLTMVAYPTLYVVEEDEGDYGSCPMHGTDHAACEKWQAQAQFPDWN